MEGAGRAQQGDGERWQGAAAGGGGVATTAAESTSSTAARASTSTTKTGAKGAAAALTAAGVIRHAEHSETPGGEGGADEAVAALGREGPWLQEGEAKGGEVNELNVSRLCAKSCALSVIGECVK